jgi:hypothetical protein
MQSKSLLGWVPVDGGEMNGGLTALGLKMCMYT